MWLLPEVLRRWHGVDDSPLGRTFLLVFGVFLVASIGQAIAVGLGSRLRSGLRVRPARVIDSVLGALATVLAVSALLWFIAAAVRPGAPAPLAKAIGGSHVIQTIDRFMPPQSARLFAGFRAVLDREGFPSVFDGIASEPISPVAPPNGSEAISRAVAAAARSIVKINGVAESCSRGQEGSGWVVSPERVVTNAHVVAGVTFVHVRVGGAGRSYAARVVVFDPKRDLAVLSVPGLGAEPLVQGTALRRADGAVVAGFPLDGPYRVDSARVRDVLTARGADIYGNPGVTRKVYSLFARVQPGNSGGPLLSPGGDVVGVVFAKSLDDDSTGYALTLDEARPVLSEARGSSTPVSTGGCAAG